MKWIFVESWYDEMEDIHWDEYISEDGKLGKYVDEDGYEEIFEIHD
jgi:hypothetical protein